MCSTRPLATTAEPSLSSLYAITSQRHEIKLSASRLTGDGLPYGDTAIHVQTNFLPRNSNGQLPLPLVALFNVGSAQLISHTNVADRPSQGAFFTRLLTLSQMVPSSTWLYIAVYDVASRPNSLTDDMVSSFRLPTYQMI
jgi:hypothetical protein